MAGVRINRLVGIVQVSTEYRKAVNRWKAHLAIFYNLLFKLNKASYVLIRWIIQALTGTW